ncbi:cellulase family glycosylhydrolase [Actinoplanes flavus]|uniref:mannan endo-1,4-beta-mannosidase n=1 Tax=Actinoplanes flavus TaxID=2820290 RepID=A0ABS3UFR3_9ACTN|nr:cellulase family glycosylhydrolase [Actinoplanes flavus]MBO3737588.1 cellulase family glycosylhydrolase [Actinoplanes flavus]
MRSRIVAVLAAVLGSLAATAPAVAAPETPSPSAGFVVRDGHRLELNGKSFRFGGTNNYYLFYKSRAMVDDVFADARAADFTVLRTWAFGLIGNADGSNSVAPAPEGVYFQYWDGEKPAFNDGPNGLERLDYVIDAARRHGIKLVLPLTNNWSDFGGIDQYVRWRGGQYHDDFYTDPVIKGWYRDYIDHVLNRVNTITGVKYRDDPTIMTWELGNEPRCKGSGVYPQSTGCTTQTITAWADEMSRHIKSIDTKHLASVGDEGFFCDGPDAPDWIDNCGEGIDTIALTRLPAIDVMSYHLYPDGWGNRTAQWGSDYITRHNRAARELGKASMLGEFGWKNKSTRNPVYQQWMSDFTRTGGSGFLYWILSGSQDDGTLYPDYDGFTVYCPSPVCTTITNASHEIASGQRSLPPVADHDTAVTEFDTPVTLRPAANDIAYRTKVQPASIDLDPATPQRQTTRTVPGGTFAAAASGDLTFTPDPGYVGRAAVSYTVKDQAGRTSNVATVTVTVKPDPAAVAVLASFETGTEGWASAPWQANGGTVEQTTAFATHGTHGLRVNAADGGWFGVTFAEPIDLSTRTALKYDLRTSPTAGTNAAIAVQTGSGLAWCQSNFTWVNQDSTTTATIDLLSAMSCDSTALADVRILWIYINPGTVDIDHVRAE